MSVASKPQVKEINGCEIKDEYARLNLNRVENESAKLDYEYTMDTSEPINYLTYELNPTIRPEIRMAIEMELSRVSDIRREVCLLALKECVDVRVDNEGDVCPYEYPRSLYAWAKNLYQLVTLADDTTELRPETMTHNKTLVIKRTNWGDSYVMTDEDFDFMRDAITNNPMITGADCGGAIVGIFRKVGIMAHDEDAGGNTLIGYNEENPEKYSTRISKSELRPGDLVGFPGHCAIYVGAGYVVEWASVATGCTLNHIDTRICWNYIKKKRSTNNYLWNTFCKPVGYND